MQYLLLIYDDERIWADLPKEESDKLFGEYMQFTAEHKQSGKVKAGEALQPVSTATTVRVRGGKTQTTDGPFAETEASDLDEAVKIAAKIPSARLGSIEIRPVVNFNAPPG